jgi:hypothetical protein
MSTKKTKVEKVIVHTTYEAAASAAASDNKKTKKKAKDKGTKDDAEKKVEAIPWQEVLDVVRVHVKRNTMKMLSSLSTGPWAKFIESKDYNMEVPMANYLDKYDSKVGKKFTKFCNTVDGKVVDNLCTELAAYHLCLKMEELMWPDDYAAFMTVFDQLITEYVNPPVDTGKKSAFSSGDHVLNIGLEDKVALMDVHKKFWKNGAPKKLKKK